jgi:hypothetical protein
LVSPVIGTFFPAGLLELTAAFKTEEERNRKDKSTAKIDADFVLLIIRFTPKFIITIKQFKYLIITELNTLNIKGFHE